MSKKTYKSVLKHKRVIAVLSRVENKGKTNERKLYNLIPISFVREQIARLTT